MSLECRSYEEFCERMEEKAPFNPYLYYRHLRQFNRDYYERWREEQLEELERVMKEGDVEK